MEKNIKAHSEQILQVEAYCYYKRALAKIKELAFANLMNQLMLMLILELMLQRVNKLFVVLLFCLMAKAKKYELLFLQKVNMLMKLKKLELIMLAQRS